MKNWKSKSKIGEVLLSKILIMFFCSYSALAADKIYTQEEFDKKLEERVNKQVDLIKKKSVSQLSKELLEKDRALDKKTEELRIREEQIKKSEISLLKKIEAFEIQEKKLIGCIDGNKQGESMRVQQLVKVISNMKPQKAADLLSVQESDISIKIIEKIDPTKASKIFNLMNKEVSARLQKQYLNMQK